MQTEQGTNLLMYKGYTYKRANNSENYYCTRKNSKCRARLKLGIDGRVVRAYCDHPHAPPVYHRLPNGKCVRAK